MLFCLRLGGTNLPPSIHQGKHTQRQSLSPGIMDDLILKMRLQWESCQGPKPGISSPPRTRALSKHWARGYLLTLSPTIMEVESYPKWKETTVGGNDFSLPWLWKGQGKSWSKWRFYGVFGQLNWSILYTPHWGFNNAVFVLNDDASFSKQLLEMILFVLGSCHRCWRIHPWSWTWFTWKWPPERKGDPFWKPIIFRWTMLNFRGYIHNFLPKKSSFL